MIKRLQKKYARYWQLYLFLVVPVAYILIFHYWPMVGLQISFRKFNFAGGIWNSPWMGLYQFQKFTHSYQFIDILINTLSLSIYSMLASFPFPIFFALTLNVITRRRFKKIAQTIAYMPHFISVVVLVSMLMQIVHPLTGLYGSIYRAVAGRAPDDLLASPNAFPHLYVWSGVWQHFGYDSIIYSAALTGVSMELHEAAEIDGASRLRRVIHIDLPAIIPTVTIMLILRFGSVMTLGFQKIYLMQNNLNLSVSEVITTYVYKMGIASGASNDYSYASAIGMFNSVINLILLLIVNTISRKVGETSLW